MQLYKCCSVICIIAFEHPYDWITRNHNNPISINTRTSKFTSKVLYAPFRKNPVYAPGPLYRGFSVMCSTTSIDPQKIYNKQNLETAVQWWWRQRLRQERDAGFNPGENDWISSPPRIKRSRSDRRTRLH